MLLLTYRRYGEKARFMMELTGKVLKSPGRSDELRVYRDVNGRPVTTEFVSIDRTHYGPEWCRNHGMTVTDTVDADNGERFEIWRLDNRLVCAIPVKGA